MKYLTVVCFILSVFAFSCLDLIPVHLDPVTGSTKDTLYREIKSGIYLTASGFKNNYTLDDSITATVVLTNQFNKEGLILHVPMIKLSWQVLDERNNKITYNPIIDLPAEYLDTLNIQESIIDNLKWGQTIFETGYSTSELKAFSGTYLMKINFRPLYNPANYILYKYFEIKETGDPLSSELKNYYNSTDTVQIDFILRNRVSKNSNITLSNDPGYFYILNYAKQDTVIKIPLNFTQSNLGLSPHSDNILFKYRVKKDDLKSKLISGSFYSVIKLNLTDRTIIQKKIMSLP